MQWSHVVWFAGGLVVAWVIVIVIGLVIGS